MELSRIVKLDILTSNKIAAGEVVEKPSAVVKELVENAIDSGATQITVEVRQGGKALIRISDNGCGILYEDLPLAFERHATSKIRTIQDLYKVQTLGFRGEALASIASVSLLEMITRTKDNNHGYRIELHGGKQVSLEETGAPEGTTIIVKDLFFNTPARLKFLKSNGAELTAITDWLSRLAVSRPDISLRFTSDHKDVFMTGGNGKLQEAIASVYEKSLAKTTIPVDCGNEELHISGYIGDLTCNRGNRQMQHFYVNGRSVKSNLLSEALELAYQGMLPINRFPICFLNIDLDPEKLDVNIHPAKIQIRFQEEQTIRQSVYQFIKESLLTYDLTPKVRFNEPGISRKEEKKTYSEPKPSVVAHYSVSTEAVPEPLNINEIPVNQNVSLVQEREIASDIGTSYFVSEPEQEPSIDLLDILTRKTEKKEEEFEPLIPIRKETLYDDLKIVGQLFRTYIIAEKDETLYLIDQHAAHEKILFERFMDGWKNNDQTTQVLMVPEVLNMSPSYVMRSEELQPVLERAGFAYESFGNDAIVVRETPLISGNPLPPTFLRNLIQDFHQNLENGQSLSEIRMEKIIQESCKKAIKAFDVLHLTEIQSLINQLKALDSPYTCPHGRPIIIAIEKPELEKRFKRI